jgi:hypothetical protein
LPFADIGDEGAKTMKRGFQMKIWLTGVFVALVSGSAFAQSRVNPVPHACSRFDAGSVVRDPPGLFSANGVLAVDFSYQRPKTRRDETSIVS